MFQKIINGYIFYFLGQLLGGQLFELFAGETKLKKQSSVVGGWVVQKSLKTRLRNIKMAPKQMDI